MAPEAGAGHDPHDLEQDHAGRRGQLDPAGEGLGPDELADKFKGRLGKAHDRLRDLGVVGPSADMKVAEAARAFVARLRDGRLMTMAEVSREADQLCAAVQAHDSSTTQAPAGPIDPVQTA
jgi:hypothetical protein